MKQSRKGIVCMVMAGALVFSSVLGVNVNSQAAPKTKKIVLNKKKVTLEVGQTFKVKVKKVKPKKASKKVTFKSSKKAVATVSKKGVITAKSAGKATITVTSKKNKKAKAKVKVTVTNKSSDNGTNATPTPSSGTNATPTPPSGTNATPTPTPKPTPDTPSGMVAYKIADDAAITIDGNEDEAYKIASALPISSRIVCDNEEDSNTEASVKLLWNKSALYGIVDVKDELVYDDDARNNYQLDGIELFLDENNNPTEVSGSWEDNPDSFQYRFTGLAKKEDGTALPVRYSLVAGGDTTHESRITANYVFTDTGYRVEFKIDFLTEKAVNDVVGFDIIVQDCDDEGRNAEIYLRKDVKKTLSYWNNSDGFGELTLFES